MEIREYASLRALEDSHWWCRSLRTLAYRRIRGARRILDVGCGTGGMLARLRGRIAVGVDVSETALSHVRSRGLSRIARGSACALPFRPRCFDAVLALDVISHRDVPDDTAAVAECGRVLRPGGVLLIHAPAYGWLLGAHDRAVHGVRRYTTRDVARLVRAAGLAVEELTYRNFPVLPFAIAVRGLRSRAPAGGGPPRRSDLRPVPAAINAALLAASRAEGALLRLAPLPAGLSVWCVAGKRP